MGQSVRKQLQLKISQSPDSGQLLQGPAILVVSARDFLAKRNEMNMADTWDVQWMSQHATLKLSRP